MNYKKTNIENVQRVFDRSIIIDKTSIKNLMTDEIHKIPNIERQLSSMNNAVLIDIEGYGYLMNQQVQKIFDHQFKVDGFNQDHILFYDLESKEDIGGIYSISKNQILFRSNKYLGRDIYDDKIYELQQDYITARDVFDGKKLWKWELSNLFKSIDFQKGLKFEDIRKIEIEKIIGEYENHLWLFMSNGFIISLDTTKGVLTDCIGASINYEDEIEILKKDGHAYIEYDYKLDVYNGKIILLSDTNYFEIDLNTKTSQKKWTDLSDKSEGIKCDMAGNNDGFQFDESYFYFYDKVKSKVAVMDRKSFQIVWSHEITVEVKKGEFVLGLLSNLQIYQDTIYVLDRNHTLHVFEKEKPNA